MEICPHGQIPGREGVRMRRLDLGTMLTLLLQAGNGSGMMELPDLVPPRPRARSNPSHQMEAARRRAAEEELERQRALEKEIERRRAAAYAKREAKLARRAARARASSNRGDG